MSSTAYSYNGAIDIVAINLTNIDRSKSVSLMLNLTAINIYEDILCPIVYAEFNMSDSADLHSNFPLIGEEFIDIQFKTPGTQNILTYRFYIYNTSDIKTNTQNRIKFYTLKGCSIELLNNPTLKLNQKFTGPSETIIKNILTTYLKTDKPINLEPTKGPQDILITKLTPFQAIDLIRQRSVSKEYLSSTYCFFENQRGFNFATLEFLFDRGKSNIGDKIFFYDVTPQTDIKTLRFRNLIGMKAVASYDVATKMHFGGMNNVVRKFDVITGNMTEIGFNNLQKQQNFKFTTKNPVAQNSTTFEQTYGSNSGFSMLVPFRSDLPDTFIPESLGPKQAFVQKVIQNIYQVHGYGDSEVTAGDVITINVPQTKGNTSELQNSKLYAGNFLISKIRHIIIIDKQPLHTMSMELIRGSFELPS